MPMDHLFLKLAAAFLCGVTLFVIIATLRARKRVGDQRHTTSFRLARVATKSLEEEPSAPPPADDDADGSPVYEVHPSDDNGYSTDDDVSPSADKKLSSDNDVRAPVNGAHSSGDAVCSSADKIHSSDSDSDVHSSDGDVHSPVDKTNSPDDDIQPSDDVRFDAKPLVLDIDTPADTLPVSSETPASSVSSVSSGTLTTPFAAAKPSAPPVRKRKPETVRMKERKVLFAEDTQINRELINMFFDGTGIKFDFAENGKIACDKFADAPESYGMILMDIRMPIMDGFAAARAIRDMDVDWAKQIPIIAMTAEAMKDDIDRCFDAGMDDHIPKPVDMDALQEKIFEFISMGMD